MSVHYQEKKFTESQLQIVRHDFPGSSITFYLTKGFSIQSCLMASFQIVRVRNPFSKVTTTNMIISRPKSQAIMITILAFAVLIMSGTEMSTHLPLACCQAQKTYFIVNSKCSILFLNTKYNTLSVLGYFSLSF